VVLDATTFAVDAAATSALRASMGKSGSAAKAGE
jgi:hypothetical protein